ncbi:hypothetical protein FRB91_002500 [Serendipita sp. 411]|nr:hypothetical protein FRB91_002500 [Serendipita sp. 411]
MSWSSTVNSLNLLKSPSGPSSQSSTPPYASDFESRTRRLSPFSFDQPAESKSSTSLQQISTQPQFNSGLPDALEDPSLSMASKTHTRFAPGRQQSPTPAQIPGTPISKKERQNTSIRSILRGPNTPGTGRSVRFFSKDAYRVISPNISASASLNFDDAQESDEEDGAANSQGYDLISPEFHQQIEELTRDVTRSFSRGNSGSRSSSLLPLPDSSNAASNLFDISLDMPAIPPPENATNIMLSDDAIEVPDVEVAHLDEGGSGGHSISTVHSVAFETARATPSPSIVVKANTTKTPSDLKNKTSNRSSQSVPRITTPTQTTQTVNQGHPSESSPPTSTGWFILSSILPSFNLRSSGGAVGARNERCLREQLDICQKLNAQYSIDLDNRDEMVKILTTRIEDTEKELETVYADEEEQYKLILRLKKQLMNLERACLRLQAGMVEQSRRGPLSPLSSPDQSVTIEASSNTVKILRFRVKSLEQEAITTTDELATAREEVDILRSQLRQAQALGGNEPDVSSTQEVRQLKEEIARLQNVNDEQRESHERELAILQKEKDDFLAKGNSTGERGGDQTRMLQQELESQWDRTEKAMEEIKELKKRNQELETIVQHYQDNSERSGISERSAQGHQSLSNQQALKEEKERAFEELQASRQHVEDLMASHLDLQRKLEEVQQEQVFAAENAEQLEQFLTSRDQEIETLEDKCQQQFTELESLRGRLKNNEKEYTRQLADRTRHIQDLEMQLQISNERSDLILNDTAERDVYLTTLEEKANGRLEENERMRRRVHDLEQESAAKEMRLVELSKDNERVKDDNANLNIALDAKQQELELIKRRLQVKGTGGMTPAPSRTGPRESITFGMTPRPFGLNKMMAETPASAFKATPRGNSVLPSSLTMGSRAFRNDTKLGPPTFNKPRESLGSPTALVRPIPELSSDHSTNPGPTIPRSTALGLSNSISTKSSKTDLRNIEDAMEKENHVPLRSSRRSNLMVPS